MLLGVGRHNLDDEALAYIDSEVRLTRECRNIDHDGMLNISHCIDLDREKR